MKNNLRVTLAVVTLLVGLLTACSESEPTAEPTATPVPPTAEPTATTEPTAEPEPTVVEEEPTAVVEPTPEPTRDPNAPPEGAIFAPALGDYITAPAADVPPAPPLAWNEINDSLQWEREGIAAVTYLLNWSDGNEIDFNAQAATWSQQLPEGVDTSVFTASQWRETGDFDGDGADEILLSAPGMVRCDVEMCHAPVVLYEQIDDLYVPMHQISTALLAAGEDFAGTRRVLIEDINQDGLVELILANDYCDELTCGTDLLVGQWDGDAWHELARITDASDYLQIEDIGNDGISELITRNAISANDAAGLRRARTRVHSWNGDTYQLVFDTPDADAHPYFTMIDAHRALSTGNSALAFDLAERVFEDGNVGEFLPEYSYMRIGAYSGIEMMLVQGLRGDRDAMENTLNQILVRFGVFGNPYSPAAQALMRAYDESADIVAACQAMADRVQEDPEGAAFYEWFGHQTDRLPIEATCPLAN